MGSGALHHDPLFLAQKRDINERQNGGAETSYEIGVWTD